jgi:hypothetical protein
MALSLGSGPEFHSMILLDAPWLRVFSPLFLFFDLFYIPLV